MLSNFSVLITCLRVITVDKKHKSNVTLSSHHLVHHQGNFIPTLGRDCKADTTVLENRKVYAYFP